MQYFAMIDGERKGPFTLDQLPEAGVTPQTYVWCKGMKDWEKAEDVADICRFFRQRIAALQHPGVVEMPGQSPRDSASQKNATDPDDGLTDEQRKRLEEVPQAFREIVRRSGMIPTEPPNPEVDYNSDPGSYVVLAVIATIFCCPILGFVAIYFSFKTRTLWRQATETNNLKDTKELKIQAHEAARKAKMWIGLTISVGVMLFGVALAMGFR